MRANSIAVPPEAAAQRPSKGDGPTVSRPFILRGLHCAPAPQEDGTDAAISPAPGAVASRRNIGLMLR